MALKFALSQLYTIGKDGLLDILEPHAVHDLSETDAKIFQDGGHVRDPSEDETALFKLAHPVGIVLPAPVTAEPAVVATDADPEHNTDGKTDDEKLIG